MQDSVFSVVKCFQVDRFTTFWIKWNFGLLLSLDQPPAARISASDKYFFSALDKYFVSGSDKYFPSENFQDGLLLRTDARLCSPLLMQDEQNENVSNVNITNVFNVFAFNIAKELQYHLKCKFVLQKQEHFH